MEPIKKIYLDWFESEIQVENGINNNKEVIVPFWDRFGDYLGVKVQMVGSNSYFISDQGYIQTSLEYSSFKEEKQEILQKIVRNNYLQYQEKTGEVFTYSDSFNLGKILQTMFSTMLYVSYKYN